MRLFVYGSLMDTAFRSEILGREIWVDRQDEDEHKLLKGYKVVQHSTLPYPTIVPHEVEYVDGAVFEVSEQDLEIFDRYETSAYTRTTVTLSDGEEVFVYIESN